MTGNRFCAIAFCLGWIMASQFAAGEETSAEEWTRELTATYAKLKSYVAIYRCDAGTATMDATLAFDGESGMMVSDSIIRRQDEAEPERNRFWSDGADSIFMREGKVFMTTRHPRLQLELLLKFAKELTGVSKTFETQPRISISATGPGLGLSIAPRGTPNWVGLVKGASVHQVSEETIAFSSAEHGIVSIGRKSGILVEQAPSGTTSGGELKLRELRLDPGTAAISDLYSDWGGTAAGKPAGKMNVITGTIILFRKAIVDSVILQEERQPTDLARLEDILSGQRELMRQFAGSCLLQGEGTLAGENAWNTMLEGIRVALRKDWANEDPLADTDDDAAFAEYLAKPGTRAKARYAWGDALEDEHKIQTWAVKELFGGPLSSSTEHGESVRYFMTRKFSRAYAEAIAEQKMVEGWGSGADSK